MVIKKTFRFHLVALITVAIWGTTFVSTRVLITSGLTPVDIFFYRFVLAWFCIGFIAPKKLFADTVMDEFWFAAAGFCGGALYFVTENTALGLTLVSNVSLIVCISPLLTAFLVVLFYRNEKVRKTLLIGSVMALAGVALVVFNGHFILKLSPAGDLLTVVAAFAWAFYCLILKRFDLRYPILFVTRKVFFYGVVTLLPFMPFLPLHMDWAILLQPSVIANLLFLSLVASMLCFIMWNMAVKELGAVLATNYIYIVPLVAMIASSIVLKEPVNAVMLGGCVLILAGVFWGQRRSETKVGLSEYHQQGGQYQNRQTTDMKTNRG